MSLFTKCGEWKFMNKRECDILNALRVTPFINQRILAEETNCSVGFVNQALNNLIKAGYLTEATTLTQKAYDLFEARAPKRAVILAAGFGMRMIPINMVSPKAFLEVDGEPLIERQIKQLHAVGITEIYVVVGFMKEQFEYLIDEYGVDIIVNGDYAAKNNLHSMKLALKYLSNCYVVPCDIWCATNPFSSRELYSWYMVSDGVSDESTVRVNRKMELVLTSPGAGGNAMIGISYLLPEQAAVVAERIMKLAKDARYDDQFWEEALYDKDKMILCAKVAGQNDAVEINTYEQLRELDSSSRQLRSDAISEIARVMGVKADQITDIEVLKKGMTNRSFLFNCKGSKYAMRIPGEGTDLLINRRQEAAVFAAVSGKQLCDDPVYLNPENGYKVTRYIENARCCDPESEEDLARCMEKLRAFHELGLQVEHTFDIFEHIDFYESLWQGAPSAFRDYETTKRNVLALKQYIDGQAPAYTLTHIDAVPDNFLFDPQAEGELAIQLMDWEYAGMQDPHVDIAMFCIYSLYDRQKTDRLIDIYFRGACPENTRLKIYCYVAACGLLWSNWCEYKRNLGVEFGEYSIRQYRYAKDYYQIVKKELGWS